MGLMEICQVLDVPCQRAQEETAVMCYVCLCVLRGWFLTLWAVAIVCHLSGSCGGHPGTREPCGCVWDGAGDLWCGEMFNTGVTHSAGPSFPLSAER